MSEKEKQRFKEAVLKSGPTMNPVEFAKFMGRFNKSKKKTII